MIYFERGGEEAVLTDRDIREGAEQALEGWAEQHGWPGRVLMVPPDITRLHSRAGDVTGAVYRGLAREADAGGRKSDVEVMPSLGTHRPMTRAQGERMYPGVPRELFRVHRWREDTVTLGEVSAGEVSRRAGVDFPFSWPVQVNRRLVEEPWDLVFSPGQVVPHEVTGMANHSKNLVIGLGGKEGIGRSHYLGALYGSERLMGRAENPVRGLLDEAMERWLPDLPVLYALTVLGPRRAEEPSGPAGPEGAAAGPEGADAPVLRGLFIGEGREVFEKAAALSRRVNVTRLARPVERMAVYLDPEEFQSTWLGGKAVYRTRMALADGAELLILAPGVETFGEDPGIDRLIRRYGYRGEAAVRRAVETDEELRDCLGAAAHLIHGSSEGRFRIRWAAGGLSREEIEGVGWECADPGEVSRIIRNGDAYTIRNPALGLWTV